MLTISKSELKIHMFQIFRQIEESGEELLVTDGQRPVLRIQPIQQKRSVEEIFAEWQGKVVFHEDPNTPTTDEWTEV